MRIALVAPPFQDFYTTPHRLGFIGLKCVEEMLRQAAPTAEVKPFIFPLMGKRGIALPGPLKYLHPYLVPGEKSAWRFFTHYRHFGPALEDCVHRLASFAPHRVVLSLFAHAYSDTAMDLIELLKIRMPKLSIAVGGAGVMAAPERFLDAGCILLEGLIEDRRNELSDFLGLSCGTFKGEEAAPRAVPVKIPVREGAYSISLSRGCPMQCRFCSQFLCHGREFRKASKEQIMQSLHELPRNSLKTLNLEDDNILYDREFFFWFLEKVRQRFPGVRFTAENGLDYRLMTPELLDRLIHWGFVQFNFSLAVMSPQQARAQNRALDREGFSHLVKQASARGIPVISYFIAGLEGDSSEDCLDTLLFLASLPSAIGISPFYPVPGLPGLTEEQERLAGEFPQLCRGSSHYGWNGVSTAELVTLFRLTRLTNGLKHRETHPKLQQLWPLMKQQKKLLTLQRTGAAVSVQEAPFMD